MRSAAEPGRWATGGWGEKRPREWPGTAIAATGECRVGPRAGTLVKRDLGSRMRQQAIATLGFCVLATANAGCVTAIAAFQPEIGTTIVLTTTDADGMSHERVLSPIDHDGQLFVAANHWPRAWYHRALENPNVRVTRDGHTSDYRAVPVSEEKRERLLDESGFPLAAYIFTGFAPRQFLRLDPR